MIFDCLSRKSTTLEKKRLHRKSHSELPLRLSRGVGTQSRSSFNSHGLQLSRRDVRASVGSNFKQPIPKKSNHELYFESISPDQINLGLPSQLVSEVSQYQIERSSINVPNRYIDGLQKKCQSSVKGMQKMISQTLIDESAEIAEVNFYSSSILDGFTRCLLNRDFRLASKLLKKMTPIEKNQQNQQGFTPLYLATLISIYDSKKSNEGLGILKILLTDPQINVTLLSSKGIKPIHETIVYKNLPVLTNLLRESSKRRRQQIRHSLQDLSEYLSGIDDFQMELYIKVSSFIPFVERIAPDDTIRIYKQGKRLRFDYTLIGYSYLQAKRRNMSCVIQQLGSGEYTIMTINHDQRTCADLLQDFSSEETIAMIEDLLTTETKRTSPTIVASKLKQELNIFDESIKQKIGQYLAVKKRLEIVYDRKTEVIIPNSKNSQEQLKFLDNLETYRKWVASPRPSKIQSKQLKLGIWTPQAFPLSYQSVITIMGFFALSHQAGRVIYDFLNEEALKDVFECFPIKVQIPINFSLYFDIQVTRYSHQVSPRHFQPNIGYEQKKRQEFQKTLSRREKRLALLKIFT